MKRILALLLVITLAVPVLAAGENVTEHFEDLKEGDIVTVKFDKEVPGDKMDLDGFEFIGREGDIYSFRATRDMDNASITLEYSKKEEDVEVEGGGSSVGEIGGGEGGALDWDLVELGKRAWTTPGSNEVRFAIALDASKYDTDKIIVKDSFTNLTDVKDLYINLLAPDEYGIAKSIGYIDSDAYELEIYEDHFIVSFSTNSQAAIYEVDYSMHKTAEDFSNEYKAYTTIEWEEAGGSGTGNTNEPEDGPTECPPTPTCPVPEECDHTDLENKIKDLEKELEEKEREIEKLKQQPPKVVEKEVIKEVPRYITELIIKEVEKEVIKEIEKEVEKPIYITELQIKEIEKEVIKEIEKTIYITETEEVIKEVEKPCEETEKEIDQEPENEDLETEDTPTIEKPIEIEKELEKEIEDKEEDKEIVEEEDKVTEDPEEEVEEEEVEEEITEDLEDIEKEDKKLPATGAKENIGIGLIILIAGLLIKRRDK